MKFKIVRFVSLVLWLSIVLAALTAYFLSPDTFAPTRIAEFIRRFENASLLVYLLVSAVRGITLLPSTPLVLAGMMLFPGQPWAVLTISLIGIIASSAMIYWLSEWLGIAKHFEEERSAHVAKIRTRLEHPAGLFFVALWAFFPLVPTDAVCYVAGSIRMSFPKFIFAILVGELILCSVYIFGIPGIVSLVG